MPVLNKGKWQSLQDESSLEHLDVFNKDFIPETDRFHLYISKACPFAHRPYLVMRLLGLEEHVSISTLAAKRFDLGWQFDSEYPDTLNQASRLSELYVKSKSDFSGKVTVPVLWDKELQTIVNDDSAYLAKCFATDWLSLATTPMDLYPVELNQEIDELCKWLHHNINTGVYRVGFAHIQESYDIQVESLFKSLAILDKRLAKQTYLIGEQLTLADVYLWPTLIRFEAVYQCLFKANKYQLDSYKNLYRYMLHLLDNPEFASTLDVGYIKQHYFFSFKAQNPTGIVPVGPVLPWL